jgi:hypothetical protein
MKKIVFLTFLALLLTVPAWAAVNIIATTETVEVAGTPADTDVIVITYENTEPNHVRAFAFDITVQDPCGDPAADAHIVDINEAELNVDYWVYPGSIDINDAGLVENVGTPVADPCQLPSDTEGGLGTAGITVEMGSLYVGETNEPATSGILLKVIVDDNCLLKMADNVSRGAVVMEGVGSKAVVNYTGTSNTMYTGPNTVQWRLVGKPKCWCRYKNAGRQCHGDADGKPYGKNNYWVSAPEAALFDASNTKPLSDFFDVNGLPVVDPCTGIPWICADTDHEPYGKNAYRVSAPEALQFDTWNTLAVVDQNCP